MSNETHCTRCGHAVEHQDAERVNGLPVCPSCIYSSTMRAFVWLGLAGFVLFALFMLALMPVLR